MTQSFHDAMAQGYALNEPAIPIGSPIDGDAALGDVRVQVSLGVLNRHGLIAGATGTGKTKTIQLLAGELSKAGVPVFVTDIKGDVTGLGAPGDATNPRVVERCQQLAWTFAPSAHPVEFLSLSGKLGAQIRATTHSFGPVLLGKVLGLNDTQTSILSIVFKYCDDNQLPLLDLADLRTTLNYLGSDAAKATLADYGGIAPASLGVINRALITLEQQGADAFFGEPEFDVNDLIRTTSDGQGIISILELSDVMDKPALFGTFVLWMLAQLYHALPEIGDPVKPRLAFFFDEAHLLFDDASKALLDEIEQTVRLIRSKGVGVFFATQTPTDIPASVLAQLGNRFQHALRAFTPQDADDIKKTVQTFPMTSFFDVGQRIQQLGTGEALVTVLSPNGVPTPLAPTRVGPPDSLMAALDPATFQQLVATGSLSAKYSATVDRQSAHEIITARIQAAQQAVSAAAQATVPAAVAGGTGVEVPGATPGQVTMTQAEYNRQVRDQERAAAQAQRAADQEQRAEQRAKAQAAAAQKRQETQILRTGTRLVTSSVGQSLIRGVFGTLFGKH